MDVSKSWAVNCNIRRLFACEWVSLDSSDFLFLSSESHFSTLKDKEPSTLYTKYKWYTSHKKTVYLEGIEGLEEGVKFLPLHVTWYAKSPQALTGVVSSNTYERSPFSETPSHRHSDISAHENENETMSP